MGGGESELLGAYLLGIQSGCLAQNGLFLSHHGGGGGGWGGEQKLSQLMDKQQAAFKIPHSQLVAVARGMH